MWAATFSERVHNLTVEEDHSYCINGVGVANSLKGLCEYTSAGNFGFEPPRQALWMTHPTHNIMISMPVLVEQATVDVEQPWVSWAA